MNHLRNFMQDGEYETSANDTIFVKNIFTL